MRFTGLLGLAFSLLVVFAVASPAAARPAGSVVFSASRDGDHELYRVRRPAAPSRASRGTARATRRPRSRRTAGSSRW